jgi:hypothetical protein
MSFVFEMSHFRRRPSDLVMSDKMSHVPRSFPHSVKKKAIKGRLGAEEKVGHGTFIPLRWLNTKEAAYYLRKSPGAFRNAIYRGQITSYKLNNRLLFDKLELDRLIESSRKGGIYGR